MKKFYSRIRSGFVPGGVGLLAVLLAGCATWIDRAAEGGETRSYRAGWDETMEAIEAEVAERDFRVRHVSEEEGQLTALSWVRTETTFNNSRQTELRFTLEERQPGEVDVHLEISEIEESTPFHHERPIATRKAVRDGSRYRMLFDGIEARLAGED